MRPALLLCVTVALCAAATLALAEPAVTVKQVELRATPAADAKSLLSVPANTTVDLVKREGAWVQLKSGRVTGWAKLFDIRLPAAGSTATKGGAGNSMSQTLNLAAGSRGTSVTTGVRGLDADMLRKAVPNPQEFTTLESWASTRDQARTFASAGRLEARTLEPLKAAGASK
jgi:hypothetical protein